ncbi:transmembrane protease serine 11D [Esox lucius]|uniref:transmembrane protease serine 11D n=1 Tax=Esox lucius TaxID=8010 RepID=UPI00097334DC|nr:transmembrane protease serine 11D [Esox lucius]
MATFSFGITSLAGKRMDTLQEAEVELIERQTCNQIDWYNGSIEAGMVCAGSQTGAVDTCQGDSGGPLQCFSEDQERFYIVGVTSFGYACGLPRRPGVYAKASKYSHWLKTTQSSPANCYVWVAHGNSSPTQEMSNLHCLLVTGYPVTS